MCSECFVPNSAWCFHSLHHRRQGKKELPSAQSLRQASKWVADCCVYSAQFSILLCTSLWSSCGWVTFKLSNLHKPPPPSLFFPDNCVKNSGSVQEGVDFDENSHNSLEPRGWWEYTVHYVCVCACSSGIEESNNERFVLLYKEMYIM